MKNFRRNEKIVAMMLVLAILGGTACSHKTSKTELTDDLVSSEDVTSDSSDEETSSESETTESGETGVSDTSVPSDTDVTDTSSIPSDSSESETSDISETDATTSSDTSADATTGTTTVAPTETTKQTEAPKATATPKPTKAPKPTSAPKATATPVPTKAPAPTATPKPTATPVPTNTPTPVPTNTPTPVPTPTNTPAPAAKDPGLRKGTAIEAAKAAVRDKCGSHEGFEFNDTVMANEQSRANTCANDHYFYGHSVSNGSFDPSLEACSMMTGYIFSDGTKLYIWTDDYGTDHKYTDFYTFIYSSIAYDVTEHTTKLSKDTDMKYYGIGFSGSVTEHDGTIIYTYYTYVGADDDYCRPGHGY